MKDYMYFFYEVAACHRETQRNHACKLLIDAGLTSCSLMPISNVQCAVAEFVLHGSASEHSNPNNSRSKTQKKVSCTTHMLRLSRSLESAAP
jgi:hypothetical protein